MKAVFKWRLTNAKYVYITDEVDNGPFIYDSINSGRTYLSGTTVQDVDESLISMNVSAMSEEDYENNLSLLQTLMKRDEDGKYLKLLDYTYYYNLENDECSEEAKKVICDTVDVVVNVEAESLAQGEEATATVYLKPPYELNGIKIKEYLVTFGIPRGEKGDTGEQGPQGEKGEQGEQGIHGVNGKNGIDGVNGTQWVIEKMDSWIVDYESEIDDYYRERGFEPFNNDKFLTKDGVVYEKENDAWVKTDTCFYFTFSNASYNTEYNLVLGDRNNNKELYLTNNISIVQEEKTSSNLLITTLDLNNNRLDIKGNKLIDVDTPVINLHQDVFTVDNSNNQREYLYTPKDTCVLFPKKILLTNKFNVYSDVNHHEEEMEYNLPKHYVLCNPVVIQLQLTDDSTNAVLLNTAAYSGKTSHYFTYTGLLQPHPCVWEYIKTHQNELSYFIQIPGDSSDIEQQYLNSKSYDYFGRAYHVVQPNPYNVIVFLPELKLNNDYYFIRKYE